MAELLRYCSTNEPIDDLFSVMQQGATLLDPNFYTGETVAELDMAYVSEDGMYRQSFHFKGKAGETNGKSGLHNLGYNFSLTHQTLRCLEPGATAADIRERFPGGVAMSCDVAESLDDKLIYSSWQYGVSSFSPVFAQQRVWVGTADHGHVRPLFNAIVPPSREVANLQLASQRGSRKQQRELDEVRQAQAACHMAYILQRLNWRRLFDAHIRAEEDYLEESFHEVEASLAILSTWIKS